MTGHNCDGHVPDKAFKDTQLQNSFLHTKQIWQKYGVAKCYECQCNDFHKKNNHYHIIHLFGTGVICHSSAHFQL